MGKNNKNNKMNKVMKKRDKQLWEEYLTIKGGDFPNWYEGLSPIEVVIFKHVFDRKHS